MILYHHLYHHEYKKMIIMIIFDASPKIKNPLKVLMYQGVLWYARLDSNQWPSESESDTLSN